MKHDLTLKEKIKLITSILGLFFCILAIAILILVNGTNGAKEKLKYEEVGKIDNCTVYAVSFSSTASNFVMKCN